ncbi:MAG: hypothetical protein LBL58_17100 [Tannerellaceae bacterium]|jgi:hypothetical protein|nr:hypothetical protein [Tannerellaceae bacterium]
MGMESFFIYFIVSDPSIKDKLNETLKEQFYVTPYNLPRKNLFKKKIIDPTRIVVCGRILLSCRSLNDYSEVCLEACYSDYEINVITMFSIYKKLNEVFGNIKLQYANNVLAESIVDLDHFIECLNKCNVEKRKLFFNKYGDMKVNLLPGYFYDYIKWHKI